ncbi:TMV resistance protein N [Quillaja saponaria]|uniref:TMV resistance protein N n=1 Tax=Quillaja saponaria TaxID=32244 RepID=A0AAD7VGE5_QUISA|nr:TMV resistance protein N [Quillaja saponaria]
MVGRIIITTRNKCLLVNHNIVRTYEMKPLTDHAALQLLYGHAFQNEVPPKSTYADISKRVVGYAKGLPLALEKIGSGLSGKSVQVWESTLHQCETHLKREIFDVLKRSLAKLEANEKKLFLDIACFFEGETLECVKKIYHACHFPVDICIDVLQEKSLVTIDKHNTLRMHDMIRHMGKEIVRQESTDPMKRSRLWFHEEVLQVIKKNKGTDKIEGIKLDLPKRGNVEWNKSVFKKMKNLRILVVRNSHFSEEHKHLPVNLRLLEWQEFPFNDFPNKFSGEKLVILRLNRGSFKLAAYDLKKFQNLMIINLNGGKLWEVPDLSGIPNLKELHLDGCKNLIEIHDSVGHLENLVRLSAESCSRLEAFPPNIKLPSLKYLNLQSCSRLEVFPNVLEKMEKISWINMCGTAIEELPSSIENLVGLQKLKLSFCKRLEDLLPSSICKLENLYSLGLEGCRQVMPSCNNFLEGSLSTITKLNMRNCDLSDQDLPIIFSCFQYLKMLDLSGNKFVKISDCILKLGSLECIRLNNCKQLQNIPRNIVRRLKIIDAFNCRSLRLGLSSSSFSQELKEVRLPGTMIPKGFHHRKGDSVSFFVGKKLPKIIVAFIFALKDIDLHNHNQQAFFSEVSLVVNGIKVLQTQCQMHKVETDHRWLFDLQNYFSKEEQPVNLESYLEDGWNHVEVSFQSQSLTANWCGVHAYKNGSEDVSFRSPDALQKSSPAHPRDELDEEEPAPCAPPHPVSVQWRYDVFLSCRGRDTLKTFSSHLFDSLVDNGIVAFRDDMEIGMGELISQVPTVITESRISIIVLSENYASSTRCLDELVRILECNKQKEQLILPVFYDVDTTEVCHQSGRYEKALRNHLRIFNMEKVQYWRSALTEVCRISGFFHHSKKSGIDDASLIKEIVEHVLRNLNNKRDWIRQNEDILSKFPERYPPRGSDSMVVYTTSLGVIPPTLQACDRVKSVLDFHGAEFEERDLWADKSNEYLKELKAMLGGRVELPSVFVKGRYLGGVREVMKLNESGQLQAILRACSVENLEHSNKLRSQNQMWRSKIDEFLHFLFDGPDCPN